MAKIIAKTWDHKSNEGNIYHRWEEAGYFRPEINMVETTRLNTDDTRDLDQKLTADRYKLKANKNPFVIAIPPPNVTGQLHIGHALFATLQDIMIRYHRLQGEPSLWIPGTDHAGIATQTVVDKMLKKQGINRFEIGREKFLEHVWKWKEEYGGKINQQLRAVGSSCDWSRERFTLDEGLSRAVNEAFVHLYNKGLIYRGEYIVNWCPKCGTAIADDEVEHIEQKAKLYYFKYDKNFPITIATTRPETKLGDTAVAVNPSDSRYKYLIGKSFEIELDGVKREIKIIGDRAVDMKFGTGALGVTPAHSAIDWRMSEENDLPRIKIIDEHGRMTAEAGNKYQGLKVLEAREKLLEHLRAQNLIEKEEEIENNLSVCYRCNTAIEPLPSLQWFVKMKPLADRAKKAVENGEIEVIPKRFEKVYYHWMDNIRDWCISRQLWWGHRIPVWYKQDTNSKSKIESLSNAEIYVGINPPEGEGWVQDPDVLDTWFSSGLWPFSTLGWPDTDASDYKYFYPNTVMETGYDILFFWVARMIMMGLELTGKAPFATVYLHGLVRDEKNRKMSKSLGNGIDPLEVIEKYGADALRMALVVGSTPGQDIPVGENKIRGYRNFSNKIWNASRFVALRVSDGDLREGTTGEYRISNIEYSEELLSEADKKILEVHKVIKSKVKEYLKEFKFSLAGETLYDYFWHEFCDKYIEESKPQLDDARISENTKKVLIKILSESLIMLHPFVPYVTEAVWQELRSIYPALAESLIVASWPE